MEMTKTMFYRDTRQKSQVASDENLSQTCDAFNMIGTSLNRQKSNLTFQDPNNTRDAFNVIERDQKSKVDSLMTKMKIVTTWKIST